jgi:hypothetical protein
MKHFFVALFLISACTNPTGQNALPDAKSPKDTSLAFIDALRKQHCEVALGFTGGTLKESFQRMLDAKGIVSACESWRGPYLPYDKIEYTFEEVINKTQKKVWFRLEKDTGEFFPTSLILEEKNGRWWVISV